MKLIHPAFFLMKFTYFFALVFISILFGACHKNDFDVKDFQPVANYGNSSDTVKNIDLDFGNSVQDGFIIPSARQTKSGFFSFSFQIKNNKGKAANYFYKIYYQNKSYKYADSSSLSSENFYGSWEQVDKTFIGTAEIPEDGNFHLITDSFRIVGNPRDEKRFYGLDADSLFSRGEDLIAIAKGIRNNPEWFKTIQEKAKNEKRTVERQLELDAAYVEKDSRKGRRTNNRWKRNPRVGNYEFLLVLTDKDAIERKIPKYIQDISQQENEQYFNPFNYYFSESASKIKNMAAIISPVELKVTAKIDFNKGIFINTYGLQPIQNKSFYSDLCNESKRLFYTANIQQFFHNIDVTHHLDNIPLVEDVTGGKYTKADYARNAAKDFKVISTPLGISDCPCKTVAIDTIAKKVIIRNPGNAPASYRKENVGIMTRNGLTYGKFRAKVKLSELLNEHQVWNGLTNAVWLIYQLGDWNKRKGCKIAMFGNKPPALVSDVYSEIDFEIVKAAKHWPKSSYPNGKKPYHESLEDTANVMVTCTNWDLACHGMSKFGIGAYKFGHKGNSYELHRWDDWYCALTTKSPANDNELFKSSSYVFEIEWTPVSITWKIGPTKDKLHEVAYMDSATTSIPNNQMTLVITQEFHLGNWWPDAPYDQNKIPFPKNDIKGEIFDIEME
jgi:hypothetical protein